VVLVLDESASMTARADGVDAWTRAVEGALDRIDDLRPWDRVAVVFAGSSPRAPLAEPVEDRGRVRQIVSQHPPQHGGADLLDALRVARDLHARSDLPERRTVVLTDGSAHAWAGEATQTGVGRLQVVDLLDGAERTNHAVESLTWEPAADAGSGTWRIDVGVRRWGASAAEATVTLEGVIRGLAPSMDLVAFLEPYSRRLVAEHYSAERLLKGAVTGAVQMGHFLGAVPDQLNQVLMDLGAGHLKMRVESDALTQLSRELNRQTTRVFMAAGSAACTIATPLWLANEPLWVLGGRVPLFTTVSALTAISLAFWGVVWHVGGGRRQDWRLRMRTLLRVFGRR
jgi:hypothetical protein